MAWLETHRSIVNTWECDAFGHLTIAYYFDKLADAAAGLSVAVGEPFGRTHRMVTRYRHELRAGDSFFIRSGATVDGRLVHEVIDVATGEVATAVEQSLMGPVAGSRPVPFHVTPSEPSSPTPPLPGDLAQFVETGRDGIRPGDVDASGELSWAGYVHRFAGACLQLLSTIGMTTGYMREAKRGFSTFETQLECGTEAPRLGERVRIRSGIARIGSSSIQLVHVMTDEAGHRRFATFHQAGVHFDLEARRSASFPAVLRDKAAALKLA
jgi:acyl-CoA thioester hydrolase